MEHNCTQKAGVFDVLHTWAFMSPDFVKNAFRIMFKKEELVSNDLLTNAHMASESLALINAVDVKMENTTIVA